LRDLSQELLLPGLGHVPPNTVTLLETNAKFIEAFMVGLNTEMGRELLWRGFPTDQRGTYFRQFWEGVQPDIVLSAKSLGGGLPISAITGRADLMDGVHVGGLGGTYGGNPIAAAAALAVLDKIEREQLLDRSVRTGETIMARFRSMQERFPQIGDVRGRGSMCAIELVADPATKEPLDAARMGAITSAALAQGVVVITAGTYGNVVRLLPPINIDDALLADGLDVLEDAVATALA